MKWLQKESARYALLLVVLLAIAAIAVTATLNFIGDIVLPPDHLIIATIIWALTMGFMLIAGAFGVWAIQFAGEAESLRRLGRMVDAMDYIRDGVVALDRQGRITGLNPMAISLLGEHARGKSFPQLGLSISDHHMQSLLQSEIPVEVETVLGNDHATRTLRLRSQPTKGIVTVLISDVTLLVQQRERTRRTAFLQLVGHMAKGIANDFNDLLCGIAGHAGLLARSGQSPKMISESATAIQDCANRGILRARQLMQLVADDHGELTATMSTAKHVNNGIELLRSSLPPDWTFECEIAPHVGPVNIPPVQLEHLVQSLGLAATEAITKDRTLAIRLTKPDNLTQGNNTATSGAILTVATASLSDNSELKSDNTDANGVIFSVINALLQQVGGKLERQSDQQQNAIYTVLLPEADPNTFSDEPTEALVLGLSAYAANWHILIDEDVAGADECIRYLKQANIQTSQARGITHILGAIENAGQLDAMALGSTVLGEDQNSLLKAISKLAPRTGIVLQHALDTDASILPGIVCVPIPVKPDQLLHAMIEARSRIRMPQQ